MLSPNVFFKAVLVTLQKKKNFTTSYTKRASEILQSLLSMSFVEFPSLRLKKIITAQTQCSLNREPFKSKFEVVLV